MPRKSKQKGGRSIVSIGGINPVERSNIMNRSSVPTPMSTWERIKNFAKQHKLISRGLSALGGIVPAEYKGVKGAFDAGSAFASSYGYGRKRKQKGGYSTWGDSPDAPYMKLSRLMRKVRAPAQSGSGKVVRF
jgi:hypothetical protein